jgi:hypothetical protein
VLKGRFILRASKGIIFILILVNLLVLALPSLIFLAYTCLNLLYIKYFCSRPLISLAVELTEAGYELVPSPRINYGFYATSIRKDNLPLGRLEYYWRQTQREVLAKIRVRAINKPKPSIYQESPVGIFYFEGYPTSQISESELNFLDRTLARQAKSTSFTYSPITETKFFRRVVKLHIEIFSTSIIWRRFIWWLQPGFLLALYQVAPIIGFIPFYLLAFITFVLVLAAIIALFKKLYSPKIFTFL